MTVNNTGEYFIGKGVVYFKKSGDSVFRDVGNVPTFELTPSVDTLEHNSSRAGVKQVDRVVTIGQHLVLHMVFDNFNTANMALALQGTVTQDGAGNDVVSIGDNTTVKGHWVLIGSNDVGAKFRIDLPVVENIKTSGAVGFISDAFAQLDLTGDVTATAGVFGTITKIADEDEAISELATP